MTASSGSSAVAKAPDKPAEGSNSMTPALNCNDDTPTAGNTAASVLVGVLETGGGPAAQLLTVSSSRRGATSFPNREIFDIASWWLRKPP